MNKKVKILFCVLYIASSLIACKNIDSDNIQVVTMISKDEKINSDTYLNAYHLIQLDCPNSESVINGINGILCTDENMVIVDSKSNKLLLFGKDGKFIKSTSSMIGHGHNEYVTLADASINTDARQIYAISRFPSKLMIFDYDLNLIDCHEYDNLRATEIVNDGKYLYYLQQNEEQTRYELLCQEIADLDIEPRLTKAFDLPVAQLFTFGRSMTQTDACRLSITFNDTIYRLESGELIPDIKVEFGDNWFSYNENMSIGDFQRLNSDKYWAIKNICASDSTIIFSTNKTGAYIIDIKTGSGVAYFGFYNKRVPFLSDFMIPVQGRPNSIVYGIIDSNIESFMETVQESNMDFSLNQDILQCIEDFEVSKNPFVVLWDLK